MPPTTYFIITPKKYIDTIDNIYNIHKKMNYSSTNHPQQLSFFGNPFIRSIAGGGDGVGARRENIIWFGEIDSSWVRSLHEE